MAEMLHAKTLTLEWRWNGYWQLVCVVDKCDRVEECEYYQVNTMMAATLSRDEKNIAVYTYFTIVWQSVKRVTDWISLLKDLISPI